ncbi:MAG: type transport system ATP-binding protein [Chloroflexota bacterium]|nr:type transport system ATP-binding protein [Chloroflexota bacterium]MEA2668009.1 type transport system ATP-binding protein [Chloroflexota bacterium]
MQRPSTNRNLNPIEAADAASLAVHTQDLAKRYGKTVALSGLTMSVRRAEVFGFLGPNGAGKTTAVKLLVGLALPSAGEGWVLGAPIGDLQTRRRLGYLPELFRYQGWMTAREVLGLHCKLSGMARPDWSKEIDLALEMVGLADRADDKVEGFSKGMQQRLGLGVALLGRPELVLLDEPTSALDPVGRHDVREIIRQLKARGTAVFLNSHLLTEVEQICDRLAVVDRGRVIATGTMSQILGQDGAVRVRVTGLPPASRAALGDFGTLEDEGEWLTFRGLNADRVPQLVSEIVRQGGRVYAVEPRHETLEDRFLQLLKEQEP